MVGYYRLREMGFRLSSGAHVLPKEAFAPVEAATELVEEARRVAAQIVEDAREAFERERVRGYEEGLAKARVEAVERLLAESSVLDGKLAEVEASLTDIVVDSMRRLVRGFDDRDKAEIMVRAALRQMRREKKAELRVSSEQYAAMRESIGDIVKDFPEIELVDVVEDSSLAPPQVIVETSIGRVEGDLGRYVDELERIIMAAAGVTRSAHAAPNGAEA